MNRIDEDIAPDDDLAIREQLSKDQAGARDELTVVFITITGAEE